MYYVCNKGIYLYKHAQENLVPAEHLPFLLSTYKACTITIKDKCSVKSKCEKYDDKVNNFEL